MKQPGNKLILLAAMAAAFSTQHSFAATTNAPAKNPVRLPEITVTDAAPARPGWLNEEQFVGPANQPEWTTARRFARTRVYVQKAPGEMAVEQWVRFRRFKDGSTHFRFQEEFEIGLPHRLQLDFYETWTMDDNQRIKHDKFSGEIRYALADWGVIPLNPTLYFEYANHAHGDPDTVEAKILLGTDFATRWHWGLNLVVEPELSGDKKIEMAVAQGLSYTLIDQRFSVGVEMQYSYITDEKPHSTFLIGPSMQWRPNSRWHVDLVPLFGCTEDSPTLEAYLIIGFDFGGKSGGHYAPSSLKTH